MIRIRPADEYLDQPFWRHLATGVLHLNRCDACGTFRHPPGPVCPACRTIGGSWAPVSGRATLQSYTVVHHPVHAVLTDHLPYVVTLVDLEEGVRMVSGVPHGTSVRLSVGMPLRCRVVRFDERFALPYFLPTEAEPS
jgi:uncharacterized OB-fold protein